MAASEEYVLRPSLWEYAWSYKHIGDDQKAPEAKRNEYANWIRFLSIGSDTYDDKTESSGTAELRSEVRLSLTSWKCVLDRCVQIPSRLNPFSYECNKFHMGTQALMYERLVERNESLPENSEVVLWVCEARVLPIRNSARKRTNLRRIGSEPQNHNGCHVIYSRVPVVFGKVTSPIGKNRSATIRTLKDYLFVLFEKDGHLESLISAVKETNSELGTGEQSAESVLSDLAMYRLSRESDMLHPGKIPPFRIAYSEEALVEAYRKTVTDWRSRLDQYIYWSVPEDVEKKSLGKWSVDFKNSELVYYFYPEDKGYVNPETRNMMDGPFADSNFEKLHDKFIERSLEWTKYYDYDNETRETEGEGKKEKAWTGLSGDISWHLWMEEETGEYANEKMVKFRTAPDLNFVIKQRSADAIIIDTLLKARAKIADIRLDSPDLIKG